MDHVAGPLHILLAEKDRKIWFNIMCLKLDQFKRITMWCLSILECTMKFIQKFVMLEKNIKKSHGLSKFATFIHNLPCRIPCRLFIHKLFSEPLGLHLLVCSEVGRSPPFRPMRALTLPWSWAFSLVCEVALRLHSSFLLPYTCTYSYWGGLYMREVES